MHVCEGTSITFPWSLPLSDPGIEITVLRLQRDPTEIILQKRAFNKPNVKNGFAFESSNLVMLNASMENNGSYSLHLTGIRTKYYDVTIIVHKMSSK